MCGIAGWVDWEQDLTRSEPVVRGMTKTLAPRGPDAQDVWVRGHAALGHSRLAVIDIEGGEQPMARTGRDGGLAVLTFSGEIYNFRELRAELAAHGWTFTTRSDTEVLLTAYLQWGTGFAERLDGMYAFAIWDRRTEKLLLVRDRFGIKPLYYAKAGDGIVFGSEPKALLAHPDLTAELDREGVAELMSVPRARTPGHGTFRGMKEVRPGRMVVVSRSGSREIPYWQLEAGPHTEDFAATTSRVRELLTDIVRHQVVADVPVGTLLSGGIDSSVVTALAARELDGRLAGFSVNPPAAGRPGSDAWRPSPDGPYAELVARSLGIDHLVTDISVDDLVQRFDVGVGARDLPGWGDLDTSMYLLFRTIREHCTVALSGEAADEMFGGYLWQLEEDFVGHSSFPWMHGRRQPEFLLHEDVRRAVEPGRYEADRYHEALGAVPSLPGEDPVRRRQREVFHLGLTHWLPGLLDRQDRLSMALGLEVRVPFADHRLAQYLFDVPPELKAYGGTAKALLRGAAAGLLPDEVVNRPKSAYPASRNAQYVARMRELVLDLLAEPNAPVFELLDREKVRAVVTSRLEGLPGPITAVTPAISLSYLLEMNQWLRSYQVRVTL
ncbi:asparagine synthase (glutamine-hydrolyzing) [Streptomyces apocyni]|uniref:asparagine synthase (glutamine-hydrolyzing) n=1 Tax=Streptomyces apocyni TaxID=2654677 RepID=UPI0012EA4F7E|nr:asparagine synthase (glutamine-hydrolyzing) [Streptomyces apocyni]